MPGGGGYSDGNFGIAGYYGYWWSATEDDADGAWFRSMVYDYENVYRGSNDETYLFSVRCVQDTGGQK